MVELRNANACDHIRFVFSAILLMFSLVVTSYAIVMQKTSFFDAVPGWAALLLFIVDLFLLGIVEGLQIALVELKRQHPDSYKKSHPGAYRLGQLAAKGDNVERFLMGRQVSVVVLVFFAAKLTTIHADKAGDKFLFPVPWWYQAAFLETGLISCIVVVVLAQLMPQIVAAKYPVHFMQFIIMKPAYFVCIFLEMTGITHICWCLSKLMQKLARMEDDKTTANPIEGYIGEIDQTLENVNLTIQGSDIESLADTNSNMKTSHNVAPLAGDQFSRFSQLVDHVNQAISPDSLRVIRHYLDTHPEKFLQFPSMIGSKLYPAPQALAELIEKDGHDAPKFLTDISDPEHIPPHIVACELLSQNRRLQEEITFLKNKLDHS